MNTAPHHLAPRTRRTTRVVVGAVIVLLLAIVGAVTLTPSAYAASETLFAPSTTPDIAVDPDVSTVELGVQFEVTVPGTITGVQYYGTATNTGRHVGSLWSADGSRLATATFPDSDGEGWQSVSFATPVHVDANATYVASYLSPTGHYADDPGGFDHGITRGHIVTQHGAGVYAYGPHGGFPTENWRNSNYYVDVTFVPDEADGSGSTVPSTSAAPSDDASSAPSAPEPSSSAADSTAPGGPSSTPTSTPPGSSAPASATPTPSRTPTATPTTATAADSSPASDSGASSNTRNCANQPSACGYPDSTNTGVQPGTALTSQGSVTITGNGTVLQNAVVNGTITIAADNVTLRNVRVLANGDTWGIGLRHTTNTTIDHVQVMRGGGDRLEVGIKDVYGDATGTTITRSDISGASTGIQTHEGLVRDNYVHDLAMDTGDHVNGFTSNGATTPLTIDHNTIENQIGQTDAIGLFQDFGLEANRTITNNLLAGGGYTLYAGSGTHGTTHDIRVSGNRFARLYFRNGGSYGPATAYDTDGAGNAWTNNVWDDTGTSVMP